MGPPILNKTFWPNGVRLSFLFRWGTVVCEVSEELLQFCHAAADTDVEGGGLWVLQFSCCQAALSGGFVMGSLYTRSRSLLLWNLPWEAPIMWPCGSQRKMTFGLL